MYSIYIYICIYIYRHTHMSSTSTRPTYVAWYRSSLVTEAPALLHPALLTDDLLLQRDTASASILDSTERAELDGAPGGEAMECVVNRTVLMW